MILSGVSVCALSFLWPEHAAGWWVVLCWCDVVLEGVRYLLCVWMVFSRMCVVVGLCVCVRYGCPWCWGVRGCGQGRGVG